MSETPLGDLPPAANDIATSAVAVPGLEEFRGRLAPFLDAHPYSSLDWVDSASGSRARVVSPWGDASVALSLPDDPGAMIEALNSVFLPERFIALWHRDTKRFEIIWTAFALPEPWKEIEGRKFDFRFRGATYRCEFAISSERLIDIAIGFEPIAEAGSRYRNLPSFCFYALKQIDRLRRTPPVSVDKPFSFWVDGIPEWDEVKILDLATHLNFYLGYYDNVSPLIEIQSPKLEAFSAQPQARYCGGHFPGLITSRNIDDNLLRFWHASRFGDTARRFLYSYRIVEYCAFSYLEDTIKATIRRLLSAPNALDDIGSVTDKVVGVDIETKLTDAQKFDMVVENAVKAATLWREIERNLAVFSTDIQFDGGYSVKPIAKVGWRAEDFATTGVGAFARGARGIRNALSHGRDMQSAMVIAPTPHNFLRLQPWAALMAAAAGEIILYRE